MEKSKISPQQLFALIILFVFGTALVVPAGVEVKQDAWFVDLFGMMGGIILFLLYYSLYRYFPNLLLTGYLKQILGKHIGLVVGIFYVLFFIYGAARDLRDATELLMISYSETPIIVLSVILTILVIYALYYGIEVIASTGELFLGFILFTMLVTFILLLFSGTIQVNNIFPILENGLKPVLTNVFPQRVMFPFGEVVCFTTIFPYLNNQKSGMKCGIIAIIFSGIILTLTIMLEITVLGINKLSVVVFPVLELVDTIHIGGFIQGMRGIEIVVLIIVNFFKITVFTYAAVISLTDLIKVHNHRYLVIPIGGIVLTTSIIIASSFTEHLKEGELALKSIFIVFQFIIPFMLILVAFIRKRI